MLLQIIICSNKYYSCKLLGLQHTVNIQNLRCLQDHSPFYEQFVLWIKNMKLFSHDGEVVKLDSIEWIEGEVEVINFDVEPLDVYFAGGILVHNKGASSDPGS